MKRIELGKGKQALVDDDDFEMLSHWSWNLSSDGYAQNSRRNPGRTSTVRMHRMVTLPDPDVDIDHINRDKLDNRKCNLRFADDTLNRANTPKRPGSSSRFKGVTFHHRCRKWQAQIQYRGINLYLGLFRSEEQAAKAYDRAARSHFGDFAYLNFPQVTP